MIMDLRNSDSRAAKLKAFRTGYLSKVDYKKKPWLTWQARGNSLRHLTWVEALAVFDKEWPEVSDTNIKTHGKLSPWVYKNGKPILSTEQKLLFARTRQ